MIKSKKLIYGLIATIAIIIFRAPHVESDPNADERTLRSATGRRIVGEALYVDRLERPVSRQLERGPRI